VNLVLNNLFMSKSLNVGFLRVLDVNSDTVVWMKEILVINSD